MDIVKVSWYVYYAENTGVSDTGLTGREEWLGNWDVQVLNEWDCIICVWEITKNP